MTSAGAGEHGRRNLAGGARSLEGHATAAADANLLLVKTLMLCTALMD